MSKNFLQSFFYHSIALTQAEKISKTGSNKVNHKNIDFVNYISNFANTLRNNSIKAPYGNGSNSEKITDTKSKSGIRPTTLDKFRLSLPASNKVLRTFPHF